MPVSDPVVVVGAARTPIGGFLGELKDISAPALGAAAIRAALARAGLDGQAVDETLMGCVLAADLGQAPARQAAPARSAIRSALRARASSLRSSPR
jgi:acetyl-CoA C-acetyltransferase